jgi:hypothetical protein
MKAKILISFLMIFAVGIPVFPFTVAGAERTIHPGRQSPAGLNIAKVLFTFEEILLDRGFRITRHIYTGAELANIKAIVEADSRARAPAYRGPQFTFEFEVPPGLVGKFVLRYETNSRIFLFETARFEEDYPAQPIPDAEFRKMTDRLLEGVFQEIERRLQ